MKTKLTLFIGLFLIISLLVSCTTENKTHSNNTGESDVEAEFLLNISLPEALQEMMTYRIVQPNVSVESVADLGFKLGFMGEAAPTDPSVIAMSNPEKQEILQVYVNSGTVEYTCLSELFLLSPSLPDDDEAVKITIEFLMAAGLWYSDLVADEVIVGGTSGGVPSHLLVRFTRDIDGYPVTGPGNKLAVRIGDQGKVIRLLIRHDEFKQDKNVQIIDPATAFNKLKADDGVFTLPINCNKVIIHEISLGYYLENINEEQEYLMPYYIFQGECRDSKDVLLEEFIGWVDATVQ